MRRRDFVTLFSGAATWPLAARAQQSDHVPRIGFLGLGPASASASRVEALREGLHDLGYVEGKNIVIEFRWADTVDQLEILKEAVPHATRIGVLWNPTTPSHQPALKAVENAGEKLGVQLVVVPARTVDDLEAAFSTMSRERVAGILVVAAPLTYTQRVPLAELALKHQLPGMFGLKDNVEAGGLMSYGADLNDLYRRSAVYIDKILKGAKPADLPVEQASKYQLVINLKTAKALGLTFPPSVLARADEVIE
jgi:putative tryptophan/tyrosine transport system substrate-binding protein